MTQPPQHDPQGAPSDPYGQPAPQGVPGVPPQPYGQPGVPPQPYGQPAPYGAPGAVPPSDDPLKQPLYGASFPQAVGRFFRKYAQFNGRASRSEYLWMVLFNVVVFAIIGVLTGVVAGATGGMESSSSPASGVLGLLITVFLLGIIVPSLALQVRRLHDTGQSGLLVLLNLIPSLGGLITFILCCLPTSPNGDRYNA